MNRVIVFLLAAFDAVITAAVGLALALAPLTLLWAVALPGAPWDGLWPAAGTIWQLGNLVPVTVTLPVDYVVTAGIDPSVASFVLSLAPLAFTAITAVSAWRSGGRASSSGAALTGVLAGSIVFAGIAYAVAFTAANPIGVVDLVPAIVIPAAVFAVPAAAGAVLGEWRDADTGPVAALRDRIESAPTTWGRTVEVIARSSTVAVVALLGASALAVAVAVFAGGSRIVGLSQGANLDVLGVIVVNLAQVLYLPTLVIWALAYLAGPGVDLGGGYLVAPVGAQTGVLPGIPLLGALPEASSPWLLGLALIPVAVGAFAGWIARSDLLVPIGGSRPTDAVGPRVVVLVSISAIAAAVAAGLSALAGGGIGPGRLSAIGPEPGPVALAIGLEFAVGAGILLLAPRRTDDEPGRLEPATPLRPGREEPDLGLDPSRSHDPAEPEDVIWIDEASAPVSASPDAATEPAPEDAPEQDPRL